MPGQQQKTLHIYRKFILRICGNFGPNELKFFRRAVLPQSEKPVCAAGIKLEKSIETDAKVFGMHPNFCSRLIYCSATFCVYLVEYKKTTDIA